MGGIGKTELALQYAHFHLKQKTYKGGICWLDCRGKNIGLQIITFAISRFNLQISEQYDQDLRKISIYTPPVGAVRELPLLDMAVLRKS